MTKPRVVASKHNVFRVSQSKVNTWRRCHAAYYFKYIEKLRRKRVSRPLMFGRIVHDMLEAYANGDEPNAVLTKVEKEQGKLFRAEREEYGELVADIRDIMADYFPFWGDKSLTYLRMKGKGAELTFEVEVADGIVATGKIDSIARTPNKLRWLVEHKTGKSPLNEDHRWRNLQSALYIRIIDMLGLPPVDGTLWDWIRSKPPQVPQKLKSGLFSARGLDTLPTRVERFFAENNLNPKVFNGLTLSAKNSCREWFQRSFTPVKKNVIDHLFADFVSSARQMAEFGDKLKDKHIGRHCDWCDFEPICRAELRGLDVDFVKKSEYVISSGAPEFEPDFEA